MKRANVPNCVKRTNNLLELFMSNIFLVVFGVEFIQDLMEKVLHFGV